MVNLLVTFGVFLLVIGLMAIGVMFKRKAIQGSCGGLNTVGVDKPSTLSLPDAPPTISSIKLPNRKSVSQKMAAKVAWPASNKRRSHLRTDNLQRNK